MRTLSVVLVSIGGAIVIGVSIWALITTKRLLWPISPDLRAIAMTMARTIAGVGVGILLLFVGFFIMAESDALGQLR